MNRKYLLDQLAIKVSKMRTAQKNAASVGHKSFVDEAKRLEKEVDQLLAMLENIKD